MRLGKVLKERKKKDIKITGAKDILMEAGQKLCNLMGKISTLHGSMQLDITGCMSGTTAAAVMIHY